MAAEQSERINFRIGEFMTKTNFTGTWKFNPNKSALQSPSPESSIFVIEHHEPNFHLERTHVLGGVSDTFSVD